MRRWLVFTIVLLLAAMLPGSIGLASAKNSGGGFRSGSRATRDDGPGMSNDQGSSAGDWAAPEYSAPKRMPKPPSLYRTVRNLVFGGLIGTLFFGERFGGFGLLEVVVISALVLLAFRALSSYQTAPLGQYAGGAGYGTALPPLADSTRASTASADDTLALERGMQRIRETDPGFDAAAFARTVDETFRRVQAAWTARDVERAAEVLTVEMREKLRRESDRLRASGRINRVEGIALERAAVIDARQEQGWDQITVFIAARLVDYTTNESGLKVVAGNPFEPVVLQERWVFLRPTGPYPWRVSAIR